MRYRVLSDFADLESDQISKTVEVLHDALARRVEVHSLQVGAGGNLGKYPLML